MGVWVVELLQLSLDCQGIRGPGCQRLCRCNGHGSDWVGVPGFYLCWTSGHWAPASGKIYLDWLACNIKNGQIPWAGLPRFSAHQCFQEVKLRTKHSIEDPHSKHYCFRGSAQHLCQCTVHSILNIYRLQAPWGAAGWLKTENLITSCDLGIPGQRERRAWNPLIKILLNW